MKLKSVGRFLVNGITMTAVSLLMRSVAMAFNAYVAREVGAEAVGLYSLLSGVYGFALTLALSGINLSVTRLVSEYLAVNNTGGALRVVKKALIFALFFGLSASALLFILTDHIASSWLHEMRIILPLKLLCATLPAVSLSSVMNGYFTAVRRVYKNALSQSFEMAIKIAATVILFCFIKDRSPASACAILALGGVTAEFFALIFNAAAYFFDRKRYIGADSGLPSPGVGRRILEISLPVALTSYVRSALVSLEHSLIPKGLIKHGSDSAAALSAYGTLGSMALTVINFPYALIGSFSTLIIPEFTESRTREEKRHLRYLAFRVYQASAVFSFFMMGIFFEFSGEIGVLLYDSPLAGEYIRALSFLVPVMYTDTATDSILKGMGEQLYSMRVNIADAVISVILVSILVPLWGIYGYIAAIYVAEIINAAFSIFKAVKVCRARPGIAFVYFRSLLSVIGGLSVSRLAVHLMGLSTASQLIVFVLVYFLIIRVTDTLSKDDVIWIKGVFARER